MLLIELVGWVGAFLILAAYFLDSNKKISPTSYQFQFMNFFGAIGIIINSFYHHAIPGVVLNVLWLMVATYEISKIYFKKE